MVFHGEEDEMGIQWESERDEIDRYYESDGRSYGEFYELPVWHRSFLRSLWFSKRLSDALFQTHYGGKAASELFEEYRYLKEKGLRSEMDIEDLNNLIFPFVGYSIERGVVTDALIRCIEYENMKARGGDWIIGERGYEGFEYQDFSSQKETRGKYDHVLIDVGDVFNQIDNGAIGWKAAKYLQVWQLYLEERKSRNKGRGFVIASSDKDMPEPKIAEWEKQVLKAYDELESIRKVHERGIIREDTNMPVGQNKIAQIVKEHRTGK